MNDAFSTRLVRGGSVPDDPFRATSPPLYQTATFGQESATEFGDFDYTRTDNPTRRALEDQLAELEGGVRALTYASGMAAIAAVARGVRPGQRVVAGDDLYGGTERFLHGHLAPLGIEVVHVDFADRPATRKALEPGAALVFAETPTNPLLEVVDIAALASDAHAAGALLAIDGTAMTPWLQRPLALGADFVIHSATKGLSGHGDVTAGVVATLDETLGDELAGRRNADGSALAPFEAWLLLRGLRTLGVRLDRQQRTAALLASRLAGHPSVARVCFPGLAGNPAAEIHGRQARGPGTLISFETRDPHVARAVVERTRHFTTAVSFGGVASSISLPCFMSHASVPAERRAVKRLPPHLVRISVGLEDPDDLWRDLAAALSSLAAGDARCRSRPPRLARRILPA